MAWIESASRSFRARHDSALAEDAGRLLGTLELLRERLDELFPQTVTGITVVIHGSLLSLYGSNPALPAQIAATEPTGRPYVAGWAGRHELHVLSARALDQRATNLPGSRQMLARTAPALYARRVIVENNRELAAGRTIGHTAAELRWGWLTEGGSRWLADQTRHAWPTVARRMQDGRRPEFPPARRDAPLLGGTVMAMLAREHGEEAVVSLVSRLHPRGPQAALARAFGSRSLANTENEWHHALLRLADRGWAT